MNYLQFLYISFWEDLIDSLTDLLNGGQEPAPAPVYTDGRT